MMYLEEAYDKLYRRKLILALAHWVDGPTLDTVTFHIQCRAVYHPGVALEELRRGGTGKRKGRYVWLRCEINSESPAGCPIITPVFQRVN